MLLKKLREKIQEYETVRGESLSMAVGYSFASLGDRNMEDVFQRADREMYRDKRSQQQSEWTWRRERKTTEAG
jgi:GGDEF domain-containing protein